MKWDGQQHRVLKLVRVVTRIPLSLTRRSIGDFFAFPSRYSQVKSLVAIWTVPSAACCYQLSLLRGMYRVSQANHVKVGLLLIGCFNAFSKDVDPWISQELPGSRSILKHNQSGRQIHLYAAFTEFFWHQLRSTVILCRNLHSWCPVGSLSHINLPRQVLCNWMIYVREWRLVKASQNIQCKGSLAQVPYVRTLL